jgi:hypothetical protein
MNPHLPVRRRPAAGPPRLRLFPSEVGLPVVTRMLVRERCSSWAAG